VVGNVLPGQVFAVEVDPLLRDEGLEVGHSGGALSEARQVHLADDDELGERPVVEVVLEGTTVELVRVVESEAPAEDAGERVLAGPRRLGPYQHRRHDLVPELLDEVRTPV
jgi:hypothetical protein